MNNDVLLDALDNFMDTIRDSGIVASALSDDLRDAYWQARKWVDAWRDQVQPVICYPEPAPVLNCPHPYDRDYAFLYWFEAEQGYYVIRCCTVCGNVNPPRRLSPKVKRTSKKKKEPTP